MYFLKDIDPKLIEEIYEITQIIFKPIGKVKRYMVSSDINKGNIHNIIKKCSGEIKKIPKKMKECKNKYQNSLFNEVSYCLTTINEEIGLTFYELFITLGGDGKIIKEIKIDLCGLDKSGIVQGYFNEILKN